MIFFKLLFFVFTFFVVKKIITKKQTHVLEKTISDWDD